MAITTLYFGPSGVGAANGTSFNDRAALLTGSGTWSSYITGFNFSGTDSLQCMISSGTYSVQESLVTGLFSNPPTNSNPLFLTACDSSGGMWRPPNSGWKSSMPVWSYGSMPEITGVNNITISSLTSINCYGLNLQCNRRTGGEVITGNINWCIVKNTSSGGPYACAVSNESAINVSNSVMEVTSSNYDCVCLGTYAENCRIVGNIYASGAGTRNGIRSPSNAVIPIINCTIVNIPTQGVNQTNTGPSVKANITNCVIDNCATGVYLAGGSTSSFHNISSSIFTNCYQAITVSASQKLVRSMNRFRNNTIDVTGNDNIPSYNSITHSGTNDSEYVSYSSGDYRIKNTSSIWGLCVGAGDEPTQSGGVSANYYVVCRR